MNLTVILIVHALAGLFTILFAVYTCFHAFHKYNMQHRVEKMSAKMAPMIVSKTPKKQVVEALKKEGHDESEIIELHDKLSANFNPGKPKQPQV